MAKLGRVGIQRYLRTLRPQPLFRRRVGHSDEEKALHRHRNAGRNGDGYRVPQGVPGRPQRRREAAFARKAIRLGENVTLAISDMDGYVVVGSHLLLGEPVQRHGHRSTRVQVAGGDVVAKEPQLTTVVDGSRVAGLPTVDAESTGGAA